MVDVFLHRGQLGLDSGEVILGVCEGHSVAEGLADALLRVGAFLLDGLREIQSRHPGIGQVRGRGLFIGAEFVTDPETRAPDSARVRAVVEAMKARHVLLSTDGPDDNVLKIKPPVVFSRANAQEFLEKLDAALGEIPLA